MYLLGHTNPKLTMSVYQQVLDVAEGAIELLERILGGDAEELLLILSGRRAGSRTRSGARRQVTRV
jgi:hypothetical protein